MKSGEGISKGVGACQEALQRLLDGKPFMPEHVGLDLSKLTASIVSHEAGFDRGYLKKSRKTHLPLLAKIEACRAEADKGCGSSSGKSIKRLADKVLFLEKELARSTSPSRSCIASQACLHAIHAAYCLRRQSFSPPDRRWRSRRLEIALMLSALTSLSRLLARTFPDACDAVEEA